MVHEKTGQLYQERHTVLVKTYIHMLLMIIALIETLPEITHPKEAFGEKSLSLWLLP